MKYISNGVTVSIKENNNDDPPILYKYRSWSNDFHKKLITEPSIYLSFPSDFEDKLDCKNTVRYDILSDNEIFKKILSNLPEEEIKSLSFYEKVNIALEDYIKSPIRDPFKRFELERIFEIKFNNEFGILSLTANPLNLKMWNKYGDNLKGFCIGYDSKLLFNFIGGGGQVLYVDELPIISPYDHFLVQAHKQIFYKLRKWEFEDEYRTHKHWNEEKSIDDRNIIIDIQCIKEIIFGPLTLLNNIAEIKKIIEIFMPHVVIKYTKFEKGCISII